MKRRCRGCREILDGDAFDEAELVKDGADALLGDRLDNDGGKKRALLGRRRGIIVRLRCDSHDCSRKAACESVRLRADAAGLYDGRDTLGVSLLGPVTDLR